MDPTLSLERTSQLIIVFSSEAMADPGNTIALRVTVEQIGVASYLAYPGEVHLVPTALAREGAYPYEGVQLGYSSHSYTFFTDFPVEPGTYKIRVDGSVTIVEGMATGGNAYLTHRTLTVIALPT
jgi:hypothetical protein